MENEQPVVKQVRFVVSDAKAKRISAIEAEVNRLRERPDVVAFQACQSFFAELVGMAAEEAGQQVPKFAVAILAKNGEAFELILNAKE